MDHQDMCVIEQTHLIFCAGVLRSVCVILLMEEHDEAFLDYKYPSGRRINNEHV